MRIRQGLVEDPGGSHDATCEVLLTEMHKELWEPRVQLCLGTRGKLHGGGTSELELKCGDCEEGRSR